jgi:DNA repair exonuclease SbcCD ATPase subunit
LAWLDKLKELKEANVLNTKELEELNNCLESYAEQYSSIQSLLNQEGQLDCSHPLPFSTIFHSLYNQFKNIAEQCQKLEKEISDTTHSLTIRTKESQEHLKNSEKLELNLKEKIKKLDTMSNDKLRMETERKELEQQLTEAQRARKDANETLKVVISRTAQYLTTEN